MKRFEQLYKAESLIAEIKRKGSPLNRKVYSMFFIMEKLQGIAPADGVTTYIPENKHVESTES